eukprot:7322605-Pyramimonas_sp.AAC.1
MGISFSPEELAAAEAGQTLTDQRLTGQRSAEVAGAARFWRWYRMLPGHRRRLLRWVPVPTWVIPDKGGSDGGALDVGGEEGGEGEVDDRGVMEGAAEAAEGENKEVGEAWLAALAANQRRAEGSAGSTRRCDAPSHFEKDAA